MSETSFILNYKKTRVLPPATATDHNKSFPTKECALNFCVMLIKLGGEPVELVTLIHGEEDAIVDGQELERAVDSRRAKMELETVAV